MSWEYVLISIVVEVWYVEMWSDAMLYTIKFGLGCFHIVCEDHPIYFFWCERVAREWFEFIFDNVLFSRSIIVEGFG